MPASGGQGGPTRTTLSSVSPHKPTPPNTHPGPQPSARLGTGTWATPASHTYSWRRAPGSDRLHWPGGAPPRPTAPAGRQCLGAGPSLPLPRRPISAAARGSPRLRLARVGAVSPARGAGAGVNEVEAIPPPPRLPPRPARPAPRAPSPAPASGSAGCALHRTLASRTQRSGPRWPSAARCPSASWRGRTCPPRTCERGRGGNLNFPEGRCSLRLTFPGSTRPAHK